MAEKLMTAFGEVYVTILDHARVKFENGMDGNPLPFHVNGVPVALSIIVSVAEDGAARVHRSEYGDGMAQDDARMAAHIDVRRTDKGTRWRPVRASMPARKRIVGQALPQFIETARKLRVERAVRGIEVYRTQAKANRSQAESYRANAIKADVEAAHCDALADALQEQTAWAAETVPAARTEQEVR